MVAESATYVIRSCPCWVGVGLAAGRDVRVTPCFRPLFHIGKIRKEGHMFSNFEHRSPLSDSLLRGPLYKAGKVGAALVGQEWGSGIPPSRASVPLENP